MSTPEPDPSAPGRPPEHRSEGPPAENTPPAHDPTREDVEEGNIPDTAGGAAGYGADDAVDTSPEGRGD